MRFVKSLCLVLAMLLALGGGLAEAGEELVSQDVERPAEELELSLEEALIGAEDGSGVSAAEEQAVELEPESKEAPAAEPTVEPTAEPARVEKIVVPEQVVLGVGEKLQLVPVVEPADDSGRFSLSSF